MKLISMQWMAHMNKPSYSYVSNCQRNVVIPQVLYSVVMALSSHIGEQV